MNRILIVDDNLDNQEILGRRLQALGPFEIAFACNGREALEIASVIKPDLILMDLRMPVMDGYEATQALRQTDWGRKTPVIAITAYASREHKQKALNAGCCEFIAKPILDFSQVVKTIRELLKVGDTHAEGHHVQAA